MGGDEGRPASISTLFLRLQTHSGKQRGEGNKQTIITHFKIGGDDKQSLRLTTRGGDR